MRCGEVRRPSQFQSTCLSAAVAELGSLSRCAYAMKNLPPVIAESSRPRNSCWILWVPLTFIIIASAGFIFHSVSRRATVPSPSEFDFPGIVSVTVQTFETNSNGAVTASVAIRNDSDDLVEFGYGTQIRTPQGWAHTNGNPAQLLLRSEDDSRLPPRSERVVKVARPAPRETWRVVAVCTTPPDGDRQRGVPISYYSQEIDP